MQTAAPPSDSPEARARALVKEAFAGTPGRLRLFGAVAVTACLIFGIVAFVFGTKLDNALGDERSHAAQLVRVETVRTSLVKADANATNAFLVGGIEPADARTGYDNGISTAATTLAAAAGADSSDATALRSVNDALEHYSGLIQSARANNRLGYPIGAAYLRSAHTTIDDNALPALQTLETAERARVVSAANAARDAQVVLGVLAGLVVAALLVVQIWLFGRTHRVLNVPMVAATCLVVVLGFVGFAVFGWSLSQERNARTGPYAQVSALASARINGFDAKSAEALTLINRGSGDAYEARFEQVAPAATAALRDAPGQGGDAFAAYVRAHEQLHALDQNGNWDAAVKSATGSGAANVLFNKFELASRTSLDASARSLSDDLAHARFPLLAMSWVLLISGLLAAIAARRGIAQRLQEYR